MTAVAAAIDEMFNGKEHGKNSKVGFILIAFEFGNAAEGQRCNYMSNASREDVIVLLKEQFARFEGQAEVSGTA